MKPTEAKDNIILWLKIMTFVPFLLLFLILTLSTLTVCGIIHLLFPSFITFFK